MKEHDAFISHASEDKKTIVRRLVDGLTAKGYRIWFDEFSLKVGDSLRRSIDKGLRNSRFGIIILSKAFFSKEWPNYELDGLLEIDLENPGMILPIWHGINKKDIMAYSTSLADRVAIATGKQPLSQIITKLEQKLGEDCYLLDRRGQLKRAAKKICVDTGDRKRGFHIIQCKQMDRLVNKVETIIRTELIINPFDKSLSFFEFHHWQDAKGKLSFIRSEILDKLSGNIITHKRRIEQNDGNKFRVKLLFALTAAKPLNLTIEIRTTNYFPNLFKVGTGYTDFHIRFPIDHFHYNLIMPNKKDYLNMAVFANNKRLQQFKTTSEISVPFYKKSVNIGDNLKFTINNKNFP